MYASPFSRRDRCRSSTTASTSARRMKLGCLGAVLMAVSMIAKAQDAGFSHTGSTDSPWSVTPDAPYLGDTTFNQGLYQLDGFTGSFYNNFLGKKIVRLSNGDVIVAGLVPEGSGGASAPINLGLVRYNSAGQNVAWSNPGIYGVLGNKFVVFPNTTDITDPHSVKNIQDIKVTSNRILVLVNHPFGGTADTDVEIQVFGMDGGHIQSTTVVGSGLDEYAGGMVLRSNLMFPETITVGVVASTFSGVWRPTFVSGTLEADSTINFDPVVYPNPGNYCPANRGCILRGIAQGGGGGTAPATRFYLAGARQANIPDNNNWDFLVMAVNFNGSAIASFGGAGVTTVPFFEGGDNYNDANSIQVNRTGLLANAHDEIYISGFVDRECKDGFGIAKLKDTGLLDTTFGKVVGGGRSGKMVLGGAIPPFNGSCSDLPLFSTSDSYANDSSLANGKLALAGYTSKFNFPLCSVGQPCHEEDVDGMIAVVDTTHGDVDSFRTYPYMVSVGGTRTRHTGFWGITESGNGTFTATGDARYFQNGAGQPPGPQRYATLRVRDDGIFANGFD